MTREITIIPVLNGYICSVGCQRVVFQDRRQMLAEIGTYLESPEDTEKRYLEDAVNKMPEGPTTAPEQSVAGEALNVPPYPRPLRR